MILYHNVFSFRDDKITALFVEVAVVVTVECSTTSVKVLNDMENFCVKLQGSVDTVLSYWFLCQRLYMGSEINGSVLQD